VLSASLFAPDPNCCPADVCSEQSCDDGLCVKRAAIFASISECGAPAEQYEHLSTYFEIFEDYTLALHMIKFIICSFSKPLYL
jgi:hypothetical protein